MSDVNHSIDLKSPPTPLHYTPPSTPLRILFFDDQIIVLDKPSGLLTVPGKHQDHKDCLERRVRAEFPDARIVHRLDMDTSGLLVMARSPEAHRHLGLQFEKRYVDKAYEAIVWEIVKDDHGTINLPLRCDWPNRPRQMVDFDLGRKAMTDWKVLKRDQYNTRIALFPKTGRSHQLRVHMLELGHPILGDNLYATSDALNATARLCLHATKLEFHHPYGGARHTFVSPCPF